MDKANNKSRSIVTDQINAENSNALLPHLCDGMAVFTLIIVGELIALALVLVKTSLPAFSWSYFGYVSMIVQWIMLLSALALCRMSTLFLRFSPIASGCLAYFTVLFIALCVITSALQIVDGYVDGAALLKNMLLAAIFSGILLRYLYLQQQLRQQQQAELQSRIQALHARIRPHFLFNSMNAVASLIPVEPLVAEKVVEDLSRLFRVSLQEPSLVPLEEELDLCRRYVDIEKVRLDDRLQVQWCFEHDENQLVMVPSLILQPLIENAIYHGIQRMEQGGCIEIMTRIELTTSEPTLVITVTNPVPVLHDNRTDTAASLDSLENMFDGNDGNHMARSNIAYRLQAHYGKTASISSTYIAGDKVASAAALASKNRADSQCCYQVVLSLPVRQPD